MEPLSLPGRRQAFVEALYRLHWAVASENPRLSGDARRSLAKLRRSFAGPRQEAEAYEIVFPHDPPPREQERWLLVAGLFALHPHRNTARGRTVGGAMKLVADERESARHRFTQLLSVGPGHLPYYLRQTIQLLRSSEVALDYHRLLTDLVQIDAGRDAAHTVRLNWARDFYRPRKPVRRSTNADAAESPDPDVPAALPLEEQAEGIQ